MQVKAAIDRVMTRLSDKSGKRWNREDHLDNLNFGLTDLARRTGIFRHIMPLETGQEPYEFKLNKGTHNVYLVEYNNVILQPTSWRELMERDTEFATRTGTPTHWYQDVSDITKIRVWPIPEDNDEDLIDIYPDGWGDLDGDADEFPAYGAISYATQDGLSVPMLYSNPTSDPDAPDDESTDEAEHVGAIVAGTDATGTYEIEVFQDPEFGIWANASSGECGIVYFAYASKLRVGYSYVPDDLSSEQAEIPLPDQVEEALIHWMMVRAYERDGETIELNKARYFRNEYESIIDELTRRANDGFNARPRRTKGWWI